MCKDPMRILVAAYIRNLTRWCSAQAICIQLYLYEELYNNIIMMIQLDGSLRICTSAACDVLQWQEDLQSPSIPVQPSR